MSYGPQDFRRCRRQKRITKPDAKTGKAFEKFIDARLGNAGNEVFTLEVMPQTSFAMVEGDITANLIATRGMTPAQVNAIAASTTEAMKSGVGQFGEYAAGKYLIQKAEAKLKKLQPAR
ncbi:hypothetical protein [Parasedimentitalea maritima]|uniref:Uncharacterized protein n=1 Tax=Parasedimentitalea maritima TaxID=2578117 RepID=A0A6A4R7K6_9RHOB|nr:hypothetical protein [Zongyanglinia marina]KAE9627441.1 hypothetical protein GP644_19950 [Zongyanglinia marina]